jgi:mannosyltransferase
MINYLVNNSPLFYLVQSLWRDEVFSILTASRSVGFLFSKLSFEPPVYYLLLHFWMKIFGTSEIATRSLSFLGLILATIVVIYWAEQIFKKSWLSWFLPIFFFTNPMLIYYGFEVRTYGWYTFFATLSMYAYLSKKWQLYIFSVVGGFYTHTYFIFTFFVQITHYLITSPDIKKIDIMKINLRSLISNNPVRSFIICGLAIIPWMIKILFDLSKLKNSWYFPVDIQLVKSVLGNMFIGYEGTPWYLWKVTAILSFILLLTFGYSLINRKTRKFNGYFFLNTFLPLIIVIGISFIKPLFVNRYLIPVTISEIFLIALALAAIKNKYLQIILGITILTTSFWFNFWYPNKHAKFPYRDTMAEVNSIRKPSDFVYATSSINYFETLYYSKNKNNVYFYNPSGSSFPWYVGDAIFDNSHMAFNLPTYPNRAIIVSPDGKIGISYRTVSTK